MTLTTLIIMFAVTSVVLTALMMFLTDRVKNIPLTILQNFCGAWFIFSGAVKAVDPLGTAYKMEQYFAQFESTFSETWLSFIAPIFPFLTEYQNGFSVVMIILEIILGIALIIGWKPKFTAWVFFILMVFFTFLTGFTHLTGYVPNDANFFDFAKWGDFQDAQMRVTDCGCFGDFLKLKPYTSFLKDCGLMIPAFIFLFTTKSFHQLGTKMAMGFSALISLLYFVFLFVSLGLTSWVLLIPVALFSIGAFVLDGMEEKTGRNITMLLWTILLFFYSISNFVWNIPEVDFRPFHEAADMYNEKAAQEDAMANTEILNYIVTNKETGQTLTVPYAQYLKEFRNYPKEEWNLEQEVSEPVIPIDKLSEFEVADEDGNDVTAELLEQKGYSLMIVAYKIKEKRGTETFVVQDTTFVMDTTMIEGNTEPQIVKSVGGVTPREVTRDTYSFEDDYVQKWTSVVNPVAKAAQAAGARVYAITAPSDAIKLQSFSKAMAGSYPIYTADDILLKTIIRSNPGVLLIKDGVILKKWHYKKLPSFEEIKAGYMK